mmetsp:Transcript_29944/g.69068  ORF Transcript_29944/g.69068 Transcript_29944/m.69068 type:complete len:87 (-) Transcript_29944:888-1148(-)
MLMCVRAPQSRQNMHELGTWHSCLRNGPCEGCTGENAVFAKIKTWMLDGSIHVRNMICAVRDIGGAKIELAPTRQFVEIRLPTFGH